MKTPNTSLFRDGEHWAVFAVRGGKAQLQPVEIGRRGSTETEIVRGLAAGANVIVHPSDQLRDGVRVVKEQQTKS